MKTRRCPTCNTWKAIACFKVCGPLGKLERDCMDCKAARRTRSVKVREDDFKGIDIDAIHYKRGAVKRKVAA